MGQGQWRQQQEGDRCPGRKIAGQSFFKVEPAVFRPDQADESPGPDQQYKNKDGSEQEWSELGTEKMRSRRKRAIPVAKTKKTKSRSKSQSVFRCPEGLMVKSFFPIKSTG
jgi:hypothetical protein